LFSSFTFGHVLGLDNLHVYRLLTYNVYTIFIYYPIALHAVFSLNLLS